MQLTVIIPTTANRSRAASIERAIESAGEKCTFIVVVNGNRYDRDLVNRLRSKCAVYFRDEPHAAKARAYGRALVKTPFFGFIDDDDEYLPQSVEKRLALLINNTGIDVVVGNGLVGETPLLSDAEIRHAAQYPARSILDFNWLASGQQRWNQHISTQI